MFQVEMRSGTQVVRMFNLSERRLWLEVLAPLMEDREFTAEGHEFVPRKTRLKVYEGPQLRPDQIALGRGWQSVERTASDVTERVLERAREHANAAPAATREHATAAAVVAPEHANAAPAAAPAATDLLRERLIGRMAAGPLSAAEILEIAAELMPDSGEAERVEAARQAAWALLERGTAQLAPSGR